MSQLVLLQEDVPIKYFMCILTLECHRHRTSQRRIFNQINKSLWPFRIIKLITHECTPEIQIFSDARICSPPVRKVNFYTSESEKERYT